MKQAQGFDHKSGQIPVPVFICLASVAIVWEQDDYPCTNRVVGSVKYWTC